VFDLRVLVDAVRPTVGKYRNVFDCWLIIGFYRLVEMKSDILVNKCNRVFPP